MLRASSGMPGLPGPGFAAHLSVSRGARMLQIDLQATESALLFEIGHNPVWEAGSCADWGQASFCVSRRRSGATSSDCSAPIIVFDVAHLGCPPSTTAPVPEVAAAAAERH